MKSFVASILIVLIFCGSGMAQQRIGLHTTTPLHPVHIKQPTGVTLTGNQPVMLVEYTGVNEANVLAFRAKSKPMDGLGIGGDFEGGFMGVQGNVSGIGEGNYYGVAGGASGAGTGSYFGLFGNASGSGTNVGVFGNATGGSTNWAGFFNDGNVYIKNKLGVGTIAPTSPLHVTQGSNIIPVNGAVTTIEFVGTSNYADIKGIKAKCITSAGSGTGGYFEGGSNGVVGSVSNPSSSVSVGVVGNASGSTNANYGVYGDAGNSGSFNVGVFGYAEDLSANYSGYFAGAKVYVGGNLGIGTSNPFYPLDLNDGFAVARLTTTSQDNGSYIVLRNTTPSPDKLGTIEFHDDDGYANGGIYYFDDDKLDIKTNNLSRLLINSTGLVGLGRTPSTNRLEVEGNASKSSAGDWLANSDARLKKNIQQLNSKEIAEKLLALHGITYEWNDDKTGTARPEGIQYGFTAQNIQDVFPELVEEDANGYLQTAYSTYDAMIIETLRYMMEEIKSLRAAVAELSTR